MGGVCPSKPAFERVASPPSRPAAQKSGGPNFGLDEYEDTSFRRGVPVAEVEEGSVRRGEQYNSDGTVSGLSSKRGKLNVWTLGYNSGSFVEAGEFSGESHRWPVIFRASSHPFRDSVPHPAVAHERPRAPVSSHARFPLTLLTNFFLFRCFPVRSLQAELPPNTSDPDRSRPHARVSPGLRRPQILAHPRRRLLRPCRPRRACPIAATLRHQAPDARVHLKVRAPGDRTTRTRVTRRCGQPLPRADGGQLQRRDKPFPAHGVVPRRRAAVAVRAPAGGKVISRAGRILRRWCGLWHQVSP